ncbi:hypothetical protein ENSA5_56190 [Enhygromyxa salina]|uniref:DUF2961 domain-containing protein n=1 Tax=Enhygromyxa salina TaxID=215803 RepID=A0A2S9XER1_9BACT|nr:DUF2961 domain-containing protein [Enhygromyxa salina]PRP91353.1 hypothetical protein ENSA5_56190 [Enhygromyxa salina]
MRGLSGASPKAGLVGLVAALTCGVACEASGPPRDAVYFLERLHQLDELPRLEPGTSELASTYDRAGGNALDGSTYPWIDGQRNVLMSVDGPGCIHRISTGDLEAVAATRIEILLDHGELVSMPVGEFFDPTLGPFAGGLMLSGPYPEVRYPTVRMPMPFAEHAEVRLISDDANWGVFWQIGYSRYPAQTPVETLTLPLDPRTARALDEAGAAWTDAVAGARRPEPPGIDLAQTLAPGERLSWTERGCGTIERVQVTIDPDWPGAWRSLRLRAIWDAQPDAPALAPAPAIDLPVAELMGAGDHVGLPEARYDSLIMGAADKLAYLRLPMPYREAATIELHNEGEVAMEVGLGLWRRRCAEQPPDFGYLHAQVVSAPAATADSPVAGPAQIPVHRLLDRDGRGKVVGTILRVEWPYEEFWWGEGDWQIWTDQALDEWPPLYHGTGTEEFYDGGWTGFDRKALSGVIKRRPGLVTVYGFMLNDAFNYERRVRMQVETLGLGLGDVVVTKQNPIWSSTVYWYDEAP